MTPDALLQDRLHNHRLVRAPRVDPATAVAALGAVQAQDYAGAAWAIGLRGGAGSPAEVDAAFDAGLILRTHILRPTWHFVARADLPWLVALSGPRVNAGNAHMYRRLEIDATVVGRAHRALEHALRDGRCLTRAQISAVLARAGIVAQGQRLAHLVMRAELDGVICSGPRVPRLAAPDPGRSSVRQPHTRHFTYALFAERAPATPAVSRDEALARLARIYIRSHGPVTLKDFGWWSGLPARDLRTGIEALGAEVEQVEVGPLTCWRMAGAPRRRRIDPPALLLPNYDEYVIAYRDRGALVAAADARPLGPGSEFPHMLALGGRLAGSWRRTVGREAVTITVRPDRRVGRSERDLVVRAAARYARFLGLPMQLTFVGPSR